MDKSGCLFAARPEWHSRKSCRTQKKGAPTAINAGAHKLARLLYRMLKFDKAYVETGQQTYERLFKERTICNLQRKGTNALHELPIGEALDQIAEPDQRGQNRHHALLAKAKYCLIHEDL